VIGDSHSVDGFHERSSGRWINDVDDGTKVMNRAVDVMHSVSSLPPAERIKAAGAKLEGRKSTAHRSCRSPARGAQIRQASELPEPNSRGADPLPWCGGAGYNARQRPRAGAASPAPVGAASTRAERARPRAGAALPAAGGRAQRPDEGQ
jgi:hypothetical protein